MDFIKGFVVAIALSICLLFAYTKYNQLVDRVGVIDVAQDRLIVVVGQHEMILEALTQ